MQGKVANRLLANENKIMLLWAERAMNELSSERSVASLVLTEALPLFIRHLSEALATNRKTDFKSLALHEAESIRIAKQQGTDRAGCISYLLTEVIFEYHLLREIIFQVLEETEQLKQNERDIILDSIEQAVNAAAVEFTETHSNIQQKFVNTLTHDLRTPISAAKLYAQMILRRTDCSEASIKSAQKVIASLNRLDSMIQDLLDASLLRAGLSLPLQKELVDLFSLAHEVVDDQTLLHGDRFVVHAENDLTGYFSHSGIRRSLENLIGNAVKYSTENSTITISLLKLEDMIRIEVHNTGNPISEKDQSILFQQYRRTKDAEQSSKTGWGLGLTLVKGVADSHKGSVRVQSDEVNGTSFIVELPITTELLLPALEV